MVVQHKDTRGSVESRFRPHNIKAGDGLTETEQEIKDGALTLERKIQIIRGEFEALAHVLAHSLPPGRAKVIAETNLEQAAMWAVKSLAETAPLYDA